MNLNQYRLLKLPVPALGFLGCIFYTVLFTAGLDAKGLPVFSHWAHTALWALTGVAALTIFLITRQLSGSEAYADAYPASLTRSLGCLAAAAGFIVFGTPSAQYGTLATANTVMRYIAGVSLGAVAFCRYTGRKPPALLHSILCLYLALRMINQYRQWSADPQIVEYCFYLGSYVALVLTCYQWAAFDAGMGSHKKLWACGLAAVFMMCVSLAGPQEQPFLLCCLIWVLTNLSFPTPEFQTNMSGNILDRTTE